MKEAAVKHSDESGEIMIESTIIVLLTTFILIFMLLAKCQLVWLANFDQV